MTEHTLKQNKVDHNTEAAAPTSPKPFNTKKPAARIYKQRGWKVVPVPGSGKRPVINEWQRDDIDFPLDQFGPWCNIDVQFGPVSNGLCDIDLDCREARELAPAFLPETGAIFGRKSAPRSHWLYYSNAWETAKAAATPYNDPIKSDDPEHGSCMVELRTGRKDFKGEVKGAVSMFPPSIHRPSNEEVQWDVDGEPETVEEWDKVGEPATVDGKVLKDAVAELAVATLLARHWHKGERNEAGMILGGVLARHAHMDELQIRVFVEEVSRVGGADDWEQRGIDASHAAQRLKDGEGLYGFPKMLEFWGKEITDAVSKWLGVSQGAGHRSHDQDDDDKTQAAGNGASRDKSIDTLIADLAEYSGIDYELKLTEVAKQIKVPKPAIREAVEKIRATKQDAGEDTPPPPTLEELAERSAEIIACKDVLGLFAKVYGKLVAGETEIGKILYLNATTRLFKKANHTAIKGPSAGGKSYERTEVLKFIPPEDVIAFTSMSEKALLYMSEGFEHKILSMGEAINTDEQTFQDYLLRELMSEGKLRYPVVQKDEHGNLATVIIEKNGPVAFMVTTTKNKLHPENETRMLSLEINDSEEQTKRVMAKIAQRVGRNRTELNIDVAPWHDFQRWLKAGDLTVDIPFAGVLSALIPPKAVRLRRDFEQLLRAVHAHALLHRAHRKRDDKGRIVATINDDYEPVRVLLGDVMATGADVKLAKTIVDTVQAIIALMAKQSDHDDSGFFARDIAAELKLDHSTTWRRLQAAVWADYVINLEERKGRPGRYRAKPLPDDQAKREVLPTCEQLRAELRRRNEERK